MRVRVHTAPPLPPFIHCAQDSPQPPLVIPAQSRDTDATVSQDSDAGLPNCWTSGFGLDPDREAEPPLLPPPLYILICTVLPEHEPPWLVKIKFPGDVV